MYALKHKPSGKYVGYTNLRDGPVFTMGDDYPVWVHRRRDVMESALKGHEYDSSFGDANDDVPEWSAMSPERTDCEIVRIGIKSISVEVEVYR